MNFRRIAAATGAAAMLAAMTATGAVAADTEVTFVVLASGSGLSIGQSSSTASIDDGGSDPTFDPASAGSVSGDLPTTTVTDVRGTLAAAWTVSVVGEAFANATDGAVTVAATNSHAYIDVADAPALVTLLGGALDGMLITGGEFNVGVNDLGSSYTLLSGTTTLGDGSVAFTPAIDVTIPSGTPAGSYSATITQTVS